MAILDLTTGTYKVELSYTALNGTFTLHKVGSSSGIDIDAHGDGDDKNIYVTISDDSTEEVTKTISLKDYDGSGEAWGVETDVSWTGLSQCLTDDKGEATIYVTVEIPDSEQEYKIVFSGTVTMYRETYTVSYDANGGDSTPSSEAELYGKTITLAEAISRSNATATGYKVTFSKNGGSITKYSASAVDTIEYSFSKWRSSYDGTTYSAGTSYTVVADTTMTARWTTSVSKGSVTLPTKSECTREGYVLLGFSTSADAVTADYLAGTAYTPDANITLYAVWIDETEYMNTVMKNWNGYEIYDEVARTLLSEVPIAYGGTGATTAAEALTNLGITWGTAEAPATGAPNTIYIQIN